MRYPITEIFWTIQGEGALLGLPMRFIRLAGCSIGCPQCDTDYGVRERLTAKEIRDRINTLPRTDWIWITGGEPLDHNLTELLSALSDQGEIAIATSGRSFYVGLIGKAFVSVSPHGKPSDLSFSCAQQINLVPGLNGLKLDDWETFDSIGFKSKFVTPMDQSRVAECVDFVQRHPGWRLGVQAHKVWGLR